MSPRDGYSELVLAGACSVSICSAIFASSMSPYPGADGSGVLRFSSVGLLFSCFVSRGGGIGGGVDFLVDSTYSGEGLLFFSGAVDDFEDDLVG